MMTNFDLSFLFFPISILQHNVLYKFRGFQLVQMLHSKTGVEVKKQILNKAMCADDLQNWCSAKKECPSEVNVTSI